MVKMMNELEPFVFNKISFTAVVAELDKNKNTTRLSGIKIYNIIPISETIWAKEFEKFKDIPIGSLVKFTGVIMPTVKVEERKLRYTVINIEISSVKELKLHTRDNLKRYENKYVMVEGNIEKRGVVRKRENPTNEKLEETICIKNVKINGVEDIDHLWINVVKGFESIPEGSTVSFIGRVSKYNKYKKNIKGGLTKEKIKDYKVIDINNISLVC